MTPQQPLNRRAFEAPDVETLNILIELGEIVAHSEPLEWQTAPNNTEAAEDALLRAAAGSIASIRALRRSRTVQRRLQERAVNVAAKKAKVSPPKAPKVPSPTPQPGRSYDFRLPVFRGEAA